MIEVMEYKQNIIKPLFIPVGLPPTFPKIITMNPQSLINKGLQRI